MSSDEDDLFADSGGDTDDLIAESQQNKKPIAQPKKKKILKKKSAKAAPKRKRIPDADNDSDDDGPGLFDSDDEDSPAKKPLTKRQKMEALREKKRREQQPAGAKEDGYNSGDSVNSAEYQRTQADNDFIDTEGDDADAVAELYSEQHFDRDEAEEDNSHKKKKGVSGAGSSRGRSERAQLEAEADEDNPIMMAVNKMKAAKKKKKSLMEWEEEAKELLSMMELAVLEDEESFSQKRPGLKKLEILNEVCATMAHRELMRPLLDLDVLAILKRWIQPMPDGSLGNLTVRSRIIRSIGLMTGENGITAHDLKRSQFGKVVMGLYMHKKETPTLKRELKSLIEQWSRPIFQKSGDMRDLRLVHQSRGTGGLSQISRARQKAEARPKSVQYRASRGGKGQDFSSLIKSGSTGKTESGINRVRVPFSKGFQYSVRPENRTHGSVDQRRQQQEPVADVRGKLGKRMIEKGRPVTKNVRSANISIEGRQVK